MWFLGLCISCGISLKNIDNNVIYLQSYFNHYQYQAISISLNTSNNLLEIPTKPEEVKLQVNQPITLKQALDLAYKNNHELQVALLTLERSRFTLREREADAGVYPTISLSTDITHQRLAEGQLQQQLLRQQFNNPSEREFNFPSNSDTGVSSFSARVQLNQNLKPGTSRRKQAEQEIIMNELEVERLFEEIRLNVTIEYYDLQQADEQVHIAQSAVENALVSLQNAEALERAGVGTRFDVLRAQVNLANAQQDLTNTISQQQIARRQLATRLNLPHTINISAADTVQIEGLWKISLEETIILAFQNRPELQQYLALRNIAQRQTSTPDANYNFFVNYNLYDQLNDRIAVTDGYFLGINISKTTFNGGVTSARVAQAKVNIAIAETQFAEQVNQIRFQVEQAFFDQKANLENVQTANVALEQAREALRLARVQFQAGVRTQTDVINSEQDLTRVEGNRIMAILNYNRALASLQRAVSGNNKSKK